MSEEIEKKLDELKKWFNEEIKRRDKMIDDLRTENMILIKTALKKAEDEILEEETKKQKSENQKPTQQKNI
jgi:hypothetical protein